MSQMFKYIWKLKRTEIGYPAVVLASTARFSRNDSAIQILGLLPTQNALSRHGMYRFWKIITSFFRELWRVELGPAVIGVALEDEVHGGFNDEVAEMNKVKVGVQERLRVRVGITWRLSQSTRIGRWSPSLGWWGLDEDSSKDLPNDITPGIKSTLVCSKCNANLATTLPNTHK